MVAPSMCWAMGGAMGCATSCAVGSAIHGLRHMLIHVRRGEKLMTEGKEWGDEEGAWASQYLQLRP